MSTPTRRRRFSQAERDAARERRAALMAQLEEFHDRLNDDQIATAKVMIFMEHYSARNAELIVMQDPDATDVAGYRAWQARGRQVRKGEHGIAILAPAGHTDAEPAHDGKPAEPEHHFFKTISVFDVRQTDPIAVEDAEEAVA